MTLILYFFYLFSGILEEEHFKTSIHFKSMGRRIGSGKGLRYAVPRRTQISWRITDSMLADLEKTADMLGIHRTRVIEIAVAEFLRQQRVKLPS